MDGGLVTNNVTLIIRMAVTNKPILENDKCTDVTSFRIICGNLLPGHAIGHLLAR
jgi:hypothetical protein